MRLWPRFSAHPVSGLRPLPLMFKIDNRKPVPEVKVTGQRGRTATGSDRNELDITRRFSPSGRYLVCIGLILWISYDQIPSPWGQTKSSPNVDLPTRMFRHNAKLCNGVAITPSALDACYSGYVGRSGN